MQSIIEVFDTLSQTELDYISASPTMREAFLSDMVLEHGFSINELETQLLKLVTIAPAQESKVVMKVKEPIPVWNRGGSFKTQQKKAELLSDIKNSLQEEGQSKTQILKTLNKDNPSWRLMCDDVLQYMVAKRIIMKVAAKYYIVSNQTHRETAFHRNIYAQLCAGPKTTSALLKSAGYNNPKGRKKLLQALQIMMNENFVTNDGKHWILAVES